MGKYVQIHVGVRPFEHPVLVPVGFPDAERVPGRFQIRRVGRFSGRVGYHQDHVNHWLGDQTGNCRRPGVFNLQHPPIQHRHDSARLPSIELRPLGIVVLQQNAGGQTTILGGLCGRTRRFCGDRLGCSIGFRQPDLLPQPRIDPLPDLRMLLQKHAGIVPTLA